MKNILKTIQEFKAAYLLGSTLKDRPVAIPQCEHRFTYILGSNNSYQQNKCFICDEIIAEGIVSPTVGKVLTWSKL